MTRQELTVIMKGKIILAKDKFIKEQRLEKLNILLSKEDKDGIRVISNDF